MSCHREYYLSAADIFFSFSRYGFGVVVLAPGSLGFAPFQRLLYLPRRYLLPFLPDPHSAAPQAGWRPASHG